MSQKKYRQPLELNPRSSSRLLIILLVVHLLALISLSLSLTLAWYWRVILLVAITFSAWLSIYRQNFIQIEKACWRMNGDIDVEKKNGTKLRVALLSDSLVTEWIVILRLLSHNGCKFSWLILPDMIDKETYRRLCVRLRQWHPEENE